MWATSCFHFVLALFLSFVIDSAAIQAFLGFNRVDELLWWKQKITTEIFSPAGNCTQWSQSRPRSIIYNYAVNTTSSGAQALLSCLQSEEAQEARTAVHEILVAFPLSGQPGYKRQPIYTLVDLLPNLAVIRWPAFRIWHPGRKAIKDWGIKHNKAWSLIVDGEIIAPNFSECNSDAIDVFVGYGSLGSEGMIGRLYETLISCENTRSLRLEISPGGCVINNKNPLAFKWRNEDRFPDLRELTLSGYNWDSRETSWWKRDLPSNAELWKSNMDWASIRQLNIDRPSKHFLDTFYGQLRGLESLEIRPLWETWGERTMCGFDEAAEQLRGNYTSFIAALKPLRELRISGTGYPLHLAPILNTHGLSLKVLALHEYERDCNYSTITENGTRPTLAIDQILQLADSAPFLESLTLDIARKRGEWPIATFEALSTFPNLRNLTLHLDLEDPTRTHNASRCAVAAREYCVISDLLEPVLDDAAAREIFCRIRDLQSETKLQQLTLIAGDYGRQEGGGFIIHSHYEHNRPLRYQCYVDEHDVEFCDGDSQKNSLDGHDDDYFDYSEGWQERLAGEWPEYMDSDFEA